MKQIPFSRFIPGIIWFILVLILICIPGQDIPKIDAWSLFLEKIHFDKIVHAGMFGIMMFLFSFPFEKTDFSKTQKTTYYRYIALLVCIWGLMTECIQVYVPHRDFDWLDWGADSAGALIVLLLMNLFPTK